MPKTATREDVVHLFGEISDHTVVEILATQPTINDLEEVAMRLAREDDVMGDLRRPLDGVAAQVFDILRNAEGFFEDNGRDR